MSLIIYCDGSVEPMNPGGVATYGVSIVEDDIEIDCLSGFIGEGQGVTNNMAEYHAVHRGIDWVYKHARTQDALEFRSDSQLVIRQLKGEFQVNAPTLITLWREGRARLAPFSYLKLTWIAREQNKRADSLARRAFLDHYHVHGPQCVANR